MGNLIIKNNNTTKTYECKSTYTGKPYLQVNKNSYLDLTTASTAGLQMKMKINNKIYRPVQTTRTTYSTTRSTSTSVGYSGSSSSVYTRTDFCSVESASGTYTLSLNSTLLTQTTASQSTGVYSMIGSSIVKQTVNWPIALLSTHALNAYVSFPTANKSTPNTAMRNTYLPSNVNTYTFSGPRNLCNAQYSFLYPRTIKVNMNMTNPTLTISHTVKVRMLNWGGVLGRVVLTGYNLISTGFATAITSGSVSGTTSSSNWYYHVMLTTSISKSTQSYSTIEI